MTTIEEHVSALVDNETHGFELDESHYRAIDGHEILYQEYKTRINRRFTLFCMKPSGQGEYFGYLGERCPYHFLLRFLTRTDSPCFGLGFEPGTLPMMIVYERENPNDTDWERALPSKRLLLGSEISPFPSTRITLPFTRS